jgi:hypothetical protein
MKKRIGWVVGLMVTFAPALARADFKEMRQTVFGMD